MAGQTGIDDSDERKDLGRGQLSSGYSTAADEGVGRNIQVTGCRYLKKFKFDALDFLDDILSKDSISSVC